MTLYAIKDILPNPFRNTKRYPVRREKVEALRESIRTTGFWDNVVARPAGSKAELAYGMHRLIAALEELGPNHKVDLIMRDFDDQTMLQVMARENQEEWATVASVLLETVRAVVEAYGAGKVELPAVERNDQRYTRCAPSFIPGKGPPGGPYLYTAATIGNYLGWTKKGDDKPQRKLLLALDALALIEEGTLAEDAIDALSVKQLAALVAETSATHEREQVAAKEAAKRAAELQLRAEKALREKGAKAAAEAREAAESAQREAERVAARAKSEGKRLAKAVGKAVVDSFKLDGKKQSSRKKAADAASKALGGESRSRRQPPDINKYAYRLITRLGNVLRFGKDKDAEALDVLVEYRDGLSVEARRALVQELDAVGKRVAAFKQRFVGRQASAQSLKLLASKKGS